jgi:hypothetical protein
MDLPWTFHGLFMDFPPRKLAYYIKCYYIVSKHYRCPMAIQTGILPLSGKLGKMIYYRINGKNYARSAPEQYSLSANSRKSAEEFGKASRAASLVKAGLASLIPRINSNYIDQRLRSRFMAVIRSGYSQPKGEREVADGDLAMLKGFQLNRYTEHRKLCSINPVVEIDPASGITVTLPKSSLRQVVNAPDRAASMVVQLGACICNFTSKGGWKVRAKNLVIDLAKENFPRCTAPIPANKMNNSVVLVAIGFYFLNASGQPIGDRKYIAGSIIESVCLRKGHIVVFQPAPQTEQAAPEQEEKGGVEWVIEEE